MGTNTEIRRDNMHKMVNLGTLSPKPGASTNPSPQDSGNWAEEETGEWKSQRGWRIPRKQGLLNITVLKHTYELRD